VLSDVTEARRRQDAEREQKELIAFFDRLSHDRKGVVEFVKEAQTIVAEVARGDASPEVEKRRIHTLKGNSAFFGLTTLSTLCHDVESAMAFDARRLSADERATLAATWTALHDKLRRFIEVGDEFIQVRKLDFETALRALGRDHHPIAHDMELWKLEPFKARFLRIAEQARGLAERLGKGPIAIELDHGGLRMSDETWAPFWSAFAHVVRNAVDHGLESAAERATQGKGTGILRFRSYLRGASFILEFGDDGRGIPWESIRAKARAAGLPADTEADLVAAIFTDGISTKDAADEVSGRGIGMAALDAVCRSMDAAISVQSLPGQGTTWRFDFPASLVKMPRERPVSQESTAYVPGAVATSAASPSNWLPRSS